MSTSPDFARLSRCVVESIPRLVSWNKGHWYPISPDIAQPFGLESSDLDAAHRMQPLPTPSKFLVPLIPGKVIGVGLNYLSHALEVGSPIPKNPLLFAKFNTSLVGHGSTIYIDEAVTQAVDWEVELAVIIGRKLTRASRRESQDAIFGYTVANDVTARDNQFSDIQWTRSKCCDTFGPLGPWIVPPSAIDIANTMLRAWVNGILMQEGNTSDMIFDVPELIRFCSWNFTLEAGDVIITGTPPGVGAFRKPPIYLKKGDRVDVEIEGIGRLSNVVEVLGTKNQKS